MIKRNSFLLAMLLGAAGLNASAQDDARLTFGVISDIHFGNGVAEGPMVKVPKALKNITSYGKLDALAVVGDLTDGGSANQYEQLNQVFGDEATFTNPVGQFLFSMGNHDNYNGDGQTNYKNGLKAFNNGEEYPLHTYRIIKGYPFITVSMLNGTNHDIGNANNGTGAYPASTVTWLEENMAKAAQECPGKPIFVFTHIPPRWTCYSTWAELENGTGWCMKVLNPTLNEYPQAVVFSGHSHYPLGDPRSIHQGTNPNSERNNYYTVINTGSTTYSEIHPEAVDAGIHPTGYDYVTEGLILTEQENGDIEIRRYDTYRNEEIAAHKRWVLKAPFDGSQFVYADSRNADDNPSGKELYNGGEAPAFGESVELQLEPSSYSVKLGIPQATDDDCVFRYGINVTDVELGVKVTSASVFSQFYLNSEMPEVLEYEVDGLDPEKEYTIEVTAYDSYENASEALVATFETVADDDPANDVPDAVGLWTFDDARNPFDADDGACGMEPLTMGKNSVTMVGEPAEAGIVPADGPTEVNKAIFVPKGSGLKISPYLSETTNNYTIQMDLMVEDAVAYNAIFQTKLENNDDAECFYHNNTIGVNSLGYHGTIVDKTWHRLLFVNRAGNMTVYVDGKRVSQGSNSRWDIVPDGFYLLTDNDGERVDTYLSEFAFWDTPLTEGQIRRLGKINMDEYIEVKTPSVRLVDRTDFSIQINANVSVSFTLPEWVEAVDVEPYIGLKEYTFRAKPMEEAGQREGIILVESANLPAQEIHVKQITLGEEMPEVTAMWTFDDPNDYLAGTGVATMFPAINTLDGVQKLATLDEADIVPLEEGPFAGNGAIGLPVNSYLWIERNAGEEKLADYTLMLDVRPEKLDGYNSLYRNNLINNQDGSIFIKNGQVGLNSSGLGYNGELIMNQWHRIVIIMRNNYAHLYIDGEKVGESTGTRADVWELHPIFLLFADNDGEEVWNDLAEVRYWDVPLKDEHVAQLGKVEQIINEDPLIEPLSIWTFDDASNLLTGTGESQLQCAVKTENGPEITYDLAAAGLVPTEGPSAGNGAVTVPVNTYLRLDHNSELEYGVLTTFSVLMDIKPKALSGYQALFNSDPKNQKDGSLFLKNTGFGLNNNVGPGYNGQLIENQWHRLVFAVEGSYIETYIDGRRVGASSGPEKNHWICPNGALFFADNDGEEGVIDVAELCFWDAYLTPSMVKQLGTPGMPTGIQSVQDGVKPAVTGVYDITGRKVTAKKLQKGLYIINGRKVVVR